MKMACFVSLSFETYVQHMKKIQSELLEFMYVI
jgi:hypothetical protein